MAEQIAREILLPGSVIQFNEVLAEVVEDTGGDTLKVREDNNPDTVIEWRWSHGNCTCKVVNRAVALSYQEVTSALWVHLLKTLRMTRDDRQQIICHGFVGVYQMTNERLEAEWLTEFGEVLHISNPDSNPNKPSTVEKS